MLAITPGPDILFVFNQSSNYGSRAGLIITLGLCSGLVIHTSLVALGIAVLIQQSPALFFSIQLFGVLYLLYLAKKTFYAVPRNIQTAAPPSSRKDFKLYFRGFIMNVTNPKVTLFFLAFLPQFIDPAANSLQQISWLGFIFILITLIVFGSIAVLASRLLTSINRSDSWQRRLNKLTGLIFVGLSAYIVLNLFSLLG